MKILIIGGTGTISTYVTELALKKGLDVTLLNRGNSDLFKDVKKINVDINNEKEAKKALENYSFDVVVNFIVFNKSQAERDIRLFANKTKQYVFISSASCYQKPPASPIITENTPLENPYWDYSTDKIKCEQLFLEAYKQNSFPITIIRPSHTYCKRNVPVAFHGNGGSWTVLKRMIEGKPVIMPGDGSSLWAVTHSKHFAVGFIAVLGNKNAIGEAYHITSDELLTWNNIHQTIADCLGVDFKPYYVTSSFLIELMPSCKGGLLGDKTNSVIFDNSKIKKLAPDFNTTISFKEGAKQAVDYMLNHPECQFFDNEFDNACDSIIAAIENAKAKIVTSFSCNDIN